MATFRKRAGSWQAQVRKVGCPPQSATFPTKAAAQRWATRIEAEIHDGKARTGRAATGSVAELIARYQSEIGAVGGFGKSKTSSLGLIKRGLGKLRLRDLDTSDVIRFARERHKAGAGPATIAIDLSFLGTVLRTARGLWRLGVSDAPVLEARAALRLVGLVGRPHERDRRPTQDELARLFAFWRGNPRMQLPMVDLVEFAVASCMRLGEICKIHQWDLDPVARTVIIRARKDPRLARDQTIPAIDVGGFDPLEIALRQPSSRDGRVFPYRPQSVGTAFRRACAALAIADLHFHDLRHEGVSRLFEGGLSIEQAAMISGHRSWTMLKRYTQLKPSHVTAAFPPRSRQATG